MPVELSAIVVAAEEPEHVARTLSLFPGGAAADSAVAFGPRSFRLTSAGAGGSAGIASVVLGGLRPGATAPDLPGFAIGRAEGSVERTPAAVSSGATEIREIVYATDDVDGVCSRLAAGLGLEVGPEVVQASAPEQIRFRNVFSHARALFCVIGPSGESSAVARFLARRGPGFYSVILRVGDIAATVAALKRAEVPLLVDGESFVNGTRSGPDAIPRASLNWVRPGRHTGRMLIEFQQFLPAGSPG